MSDRVECAISLARVEKQEGELRVPKGVWALVACVAVFVRVYPLLGPQGPLAYPVDYDEGVYFAAARLLMRGVFPYRDFVFVHPPGLLFFLGVTTASVDGISSATGLALSRYVAVCLGTATTVLLGKIISRQAGVIAGCVAAILYAVYPEAVGVERGPFLEPLLNLLCIGISFFWLKQPATVRSTVAAGVMCGLAVATKVWGAFWALAIIASLPRERPIRSFFLVGSVAVLTASLLLAPWLLQAPEAFWESVVMFHAARPVDGDVSMAGRWGGIFAVRHLGAALLGTVALGCGVLQGHSISRPLRFWGVAYGLVVLAFLTSKTYWTQYNSHLALPQCALAGMGAAQLWRLLGPRVRQVRFGQAGVLFLFAGLLFLSVRAVVLTGRVRAEDPLRLSEEIQKHVPASACVYTFEPGWSLIAGRLPPHRDGGPVVVDSYAHMLNAAVRTGARFSSATEAFGSNDAQTAIQGRLAACRFVVLGWRGDWQLNAQSKTWFQSAFVPRAGEGLVLWENQQR